MVKRHFEPTGISCNASVQPLITPPTGNSAGVPRFTELSNITKDSDMINTILNADSYLDIINSL